MKINGPLAVLANPGAGRGRHRGVLPFVLAHLRDTGLPVEPLEARTPQEALAACHAAVAGGAGALVVVGGDGTVHLALQALAGTDVPLGIVPAGTGNDFAVAAGFGAPAAALRAIGAALARGGDHATIDLARLTTGAGATHWFGGVLAAGFDAIVNERGNRMRWPRGPVRYDLAIMVELARLRARSYRITLDGVTQERDAVLVAVANGGSYGGGMRICPDADVTDGRLDVAVVRPISRRTLVKVKPQIYAGTHVHHPAVDTFSARKVELAAEGIVGYADGERIAPLPVTVECVPGALRLLRGA
ncbi:diacylglycerol kinase family protein [Asanoa sp. WMMD1127]|uniref:diacylglycerol kinase family protein n=1 Tax=Asanoa sp. WMMD1127 TaxID=3016107 RepID=UPI00241811E4|nr:diacylglycerol kinase family protein [Asanoa sp. WMMD1127]MDG4826379.1 diacylglycerol kinase family protein [Asanoa sp. WMMD1127]